MVGINSLDSSSTLGVFNLNKTTEELPKALISGSKDEDTVHISAEAMDLLKSKMDEYGTKAPSEITYD